MTTGWVFHELYMWHDTGTAATVFPPGLTVEPGEHAENPATKRRFRHLVEVAGMIDKLKPLKPAAATETDLLRFHTQDHIDRVKALSAENGGLAGDFTPFGQGSYEIACLSAGGVITALEAVVNGQATNAYALVRPPGHHAEREHGMGFCIFGNLAIAVKYAKAVHQVGRVAVVDWDVHHGNGTQQAFYDDPSVLTISLHQDGLFPIGTGSVAETGTGAGEGFNINVPLPPGCGHGAYLEAFDSVVIPSIQAFRPEIIVVASGFDAGGSDPMGRMMLHAGTYREMTRSLKQLAERLCDGRLLLTHEGGYSATHVPYCGLAVLETLTGDGTGIDDPWLPIMSEWPGQDLQPHQRAAIDQAVSAVDALKMRC